MEIETAPHPAAATPWGRALLCAVVLGPLVALVLLPIGFGLERYVMTGSSMEGSISRGALLFERMIPVSDLRPGDVITYSVPAESEGSGGPGGTHAVTHTVTRRVVSVDGSGIRTRADAAPAADPEPLRTEGPTVRRVQLVLPFVGWAYLLVASPQGWVLAVVSAIALVLLSRRSGRRLPQLVGRVPRLASARREGVQP